MEIKTDQLTKILREQIEKFDGAIDVSEVGEVIEVGDGVATVSYTHLRAPRDRQKSRMPSSA